jgi:hypothetical protein
MRPSSVRHVEKGSQKCSCSLYRIMGTRTRSDHCHVTLDQIGSERRQPLDSVLREAILDGDILALDKAGFAQALAECRHDIGSIYA